MALRFYKRAAGEGTLLDPLTLTTDGTPLLFNINVDGGILAQYRTYDDGEGPRYGCYVKFVAPELQPGQFLRILYGVQDELLPPGLELDSYAYVFGLADAQGNPVESWNEIAGDDDSGSGSYEEFPNTEMIIYWDNNPGIVAGQTYVIEATTYDEDETGVFAMKLIAEVFTSA